MTDWRLPSSSRKSTRKSDSNEFSQSESSNPSYKPPFTGPQSTEPESTRDERTSGSPVDNKLPDFFEQAYDGSTVSQINEGAIDNSTFRGSSADDDIVDGNIVDGRLNIGQSDSFAGYQLDSMVTLAHQPFVPKSSQTTSNLHEKNRAASNPIEDSVIEPSDNIHTEPNRANVISSDRADDVIFRRPSERLTEIRTVEPKDRTPTSKSPYERLAFSESDHSIPQSEYDAPLLEPIESVEAGHQQPVPLRQEIESPYERSTISATSAVSTLAEVYQRDDAGPRVQSVRQNLDNALEEWWIESKIPSKALLRNGLLVLQAGHSLDEAHRTLLLRTALRYRRGMVTALHYQTDPDRTAYLMKEALLFKKNPLPTKVLWHLLREDHDSEEWKLLLEDDLLYNLDTLSAHRRQLATAALHQLNSNVLLTSAELESAATIVTATSHAMKWNAGRILLLMLLIPVFASVYSLRAQRADLTGMATIPEGSYITGRLLFGVPENNFFVPAFAIEQTEVTNRSYRLCVQQGGCTPPSDNSSNSRPQYFLNPIYDRHPVVNVSWLMARQYCEWAGKRLPTEVEWEIAASVAPATQRRFDYPWGNTFLPQYANSNLNDIADTKEVGTYHPVGTTPTGATDMAGNVAEWTTSRDSIPLYRVRENQTFTVKGGSYMDDPELLRSSRNVVLDNTTTEPWLGFRCAVTLPKTEES